MANTDTATRATPLSWRQIDDEERRHDDEPATIGLDDTVDGDITDIAPLAPLLLRDGHAIEDDPEADQRRAMLMSRGTGWPAEAYASGRYVAAIAIFVVVAVVALIGITFV
jgi:hypothetical protein